MRIEEAKVTSKGQITIPKAIRNSLGLKAGGRVVFIPEGREITMVAKTQDPLKELIELRKELPLFTKDEIKRMIKESKKEWSKSE